MLGPEGEPLSGNQVEGLSAVGGWETPSPKESTYPIHGLDPGKTRTLTFLNAKRGLAGELLLRGDETKSQRIALQPWGVLTGRVVDAEGQPLGDDFQLYPVRFPKGYPESARRAASASRAWFPGNLTPSSSSIRPTCWVTWSPGT